jgi:hypothetical protein
MRERSAPTVSWRKEDSSRGEEVSEGLTSKVEGVGERKDESCLFGRFFLGWLGEVSVWSRCARITINDSGLRLIYY